MNKFFRGSKRLGTSINEEVPIDIMNKGAERAGGDGGGIILSSGYLTQGENQTVTGGISLLFPKSGRRYAVLQNSGPLNFCLQLFKDEKSFLKKDKKNTKFTEYHFTANIHIHSLEMMIGRTRKPQNIFIIVHGGLPRYFKPYKSAEMMNWVRGFQKVQNAISRKESMTDGQRSSSEQEPDATEESQDISTVTNRENKVKRPHKDSGFDSPPPTPRSSVPTADPAEPVGGDEIDGRQPEAGTPDVSELLPQVIEMDLPDRDDEEPGDGPDGGGDGEKADDESKLTTDSMGGPCRRSRMVLNKDRYEEQFVGKAPKLSPTSNIGKSIKCFEPISEDDSEKKRPEPQPRKLQTLQEIHQNIVSMRLSTWPNRPPSSVDPEKESPYQKSVFKTPLPRMSDAESGDETPPVIPPKTKGWKTSVLVNAISKQLEDKQKPINVSSKNSFRQKVKPSRPARHSEIVTEEDDEEEGIRTGNSEDPDPPYDRLSKYRKALTSEPEVKGCGEEEEKADELHDEEDKPATSDDVSTGFTKDRERLATVPLIKTRPLPKPNQETDWKNVGNMVWEQACKSVKVNLDRADVCNNLALISIHNSVCIGGWKKEVSEKIYGKLHVGDFLILVNEMRVEEPDAAQLFIKASTKDEITLSVKRLPHAAIKELHKTADQASWGLETHKNEIREISGPALNAGITPKVSGVMSSKQNDWVLTELNHQRVPLVKCPLDEVKHRLEALSGETSLVVVLQPRDFILEVKDGLKHLKHPSQYFV